MSELSDAYCTLEEQSRKAKADIVHLLHVHLIFLDLEERMEKKNNPLDGLVSCKIYELLILEKGFCCCWCIAGCCS